MKNLLGWIIKKFKNEDYLYTYGLEYFAVDHCSLKCFGCSQCSPYLKEHFSDYKIFEKSLQVLRKYLRPQKITILGGEPLLHPDIDSIIRVAKESKMFEEIHVTTNGTNIRKMSCNFWRDIDALIISKYPSNSAYINSIMDGVERECRSHDVKLEIRDMKNFKHIVLSEENKNSKNVEEIFRRCIYKFYCHTVSDDKIFRCSPVVNFSKLNSRKGFAQYDGIDYLKIEESDYFRNDLVSYLNSNKQLVGCRFCLGTSGKSFSHRQLSKCELENPENNKIVAETSFDHE